MIKLAQTIDLNYAAKWVVGICEITCPPPLVGTGVPMNNVGNTHV